MAREFSLTRLQALALTAFIWAAIYLPALGSLEIKGEEGRRILPALSMLETGQWIVPFIGGAPYLSKPPMINWAIAAAFRLSGVRNEWAARAPSALGMLALGLGTVWWLSSWLTPGGALVAAIFALTNIGLMEKGRLAEIEALYVALFGLAFVAWLAAWRGGAAGWRTWILPGIFLGLGTLVKGPLHVVFFYVIVAAILWRAGRLRDLWSRWHLLGVVLMLGIFAAWAAPYLQMTRALRVGEVWQAQFAGRMEVDEHFHLGSWLLNIPRGLANYLPWTVLLPLLWRPAKSEPGARGGAGELDRAILLGGRDAVAACFLAVSLAPGGVPRYTLPLLAPAGVLLTLAIGQEGKMPEWVPRAWGGTLVGFLGLCGTAALAGAFLSRGAWPWLVAAASVLLCGWLWTCRPNWQANGPPALALVSAVVMAMLTASYAASAVPWLRRGDTVRPPAEQINRAAANSGGAVYALDPGFLPFLFYLRPSPGYVQKLEDVPPAAGFLLVREKETPGAVARLAARGVRAEVTLRVRDKRTKDDERNQWNLLRLEPANGRL